MSSPVPALRAFHPVVALVALGLLPYALPPQSARGQLQTLSAGNADSQWREAQLQAFDSQLADAALPDELKREITAQRAWLKAWKPKSPTGGTAADDSEPDTDSSADKDAEDPAAAVQAVETRNEGGESEQTKPLDEPNIDPEGLATELRARLFDPEHPATAADTKALQTALSENSGDVGLRQLQLHWLDQPTYRDTHWQEISSAADRVLALLADQPATDETKAAAAYANYRKARALAHALRGRPLRADKVAGADKLSEDERDQMENAIAECWRQIETLVGAGQPEFFQLEIYNLRRYGWHGQALELLERHADEIDRHAYLAERQAMLEALAWKAPAEQTAALLKVRKEGDKDSSKQPLEIEFAPH